MSLDMLGAGLTGIVICMYSPFIIMLSIVFLGETMSLLQIIGALLIISAVLIATIEKQQTTISRKKLVLGVLLGMVSSAAMATGIVMIKPLLAHSPVLWVTGIRLFGGTTALAVILLLYPGRRRIIDSLISTKRWIYTISGSFLGAFLAMIVWIAGMKYTQASVASALNQTSVIFIFIFAGLILNEPVNLRRTIGIIMAFIGSFFVSFL
jgi:drug/metabolite transporter (DMT)-like permease